MRVRVEKVDVLGCNKSNPPYGVEKLATCILHGNIDSGGSITFRLALQYPR